MLTRDGTGEESNREGGFARAGKAEDTGNRTAGDDAVNAVAATVPGLDQFM